MVDENSRDTLSMILIFTIFVVLTSALLRWRRVFRRRTWAIIIILALGLSFFVAYVSVSNVWIPHPQSDDVWRSQDASGEYEGVFPWSKLSYPFYLNAYHTPFKQQTLSGRIANGNASLTVFLANAKLLRVNGTFAYNALLMGPDELYYLFDSLFSQSPNFFGFLLTLFTSFNFIGSILGIALAKTLKSLERQKATLFKEKREQNSSSQTDH